MTLGNYDWILVNSSAGKDSQAMLDVVVEQARAAGVMERVVVVHCDLGRVEWQGTRELAEDHARHYGLRFVVVSRPQGDLLTHVEQRGMWPSSTARYCTSDHKRGQVHRVLTQLTKESAAGRRQVRILNCLGIRSDESPARAKKAPLTRDAVASNGKREVWTWYPIFDWTVAQVWERIRLSGVRHHRAYDLGMPRLSCCFCIFAPVAALQLAGKHNPELLEAYVGVERRIGHTFTVKTSLVQIQESLASGAAVVALGGGEPQIESWCM